MVVFVESIFLQEKTQRFAYQVLPVVTFSGGAGVNSELSDLHLDHQKVTTGRSWYMSFSELDGAKS